MNKKVITFIIVVSILVGSAYYFLNRKDETSNFKPSTLMTLSNDDVKNDIGFSINSHSSSSTFKGVSATAELLNKETYIIAFNEISIDIPEVTVTIDDFRTSLHSNEPTYVFVEKMWYEIQYKDKNTDWQSIPLEKYTDGWGDWHGEGVFSKGNIYFWKYCNEIGSRYKYEPEECCGYAPGEYPTGSYDYIMPYSFTITSQKLKLNLSENLGIRDGFAIKVVLKAKVRWKDLECNALGLDCKLTDWRYATGNILSDEAYIYQGLPSLTIYTYPDEVLLTLLSNGNEIEKAQSSQGILTFFNIPAGVYQIKANAVGYDELTTQINLQSDCILTVNMSTGQIGEGIPSEQPSISPVEPPVVYVTVNPTSAIVSCSEQRENEWYSAGRSIKLSPNKWKIEGLQPGNSYRLNIYSFELREDVYARKWINEEEFFTMYNEDMFFNIQLEEDTSSPNQPPIAYTPTTEDSNFRVSIEYTFNFKYWDNEGDTIKTIEIDWGDGNFEQKGENKNLNSATHIYSIPGEYKIRVRASQVAYNDAEYKFWKSAGLSDPFNWGAWSPPLTIEVIKWNKPPSVEFYFPKEGMTGAPGVPYKFKIKGFDPEGKELTYQVDWGDGVKTNPMRDFNGYLYPIHSYLTIGVYNVKVIVSDGVNTETYDTLTVESTGETSKYFKVEVQKLPSPQIFSLHIAGKGKTSKAIIKVYTTIPTQYFDIYAQVTDKTGIIFEKQKLDKLFTGTSYSATLTFVTNVIGDVQIKAQCIPTANIKGYKPSDMVTKIGGCVDKVDMNVPGEYIILEPTIIAFDAQVGRESTVTITINTNYAPSDFDIYAVVKDNQENTLVAWAPIIKRKTGDFKYAGEIKYTPTKTGRITIQAQGISIDKESTIATKIVNCKTEEPKEGYDWGDIYNPENDTLRNPELIKDLYNPMKNTQKAFDFFEIIVTVIVIIAISIIALIIRRRRV